jgi:hypothetical protein
MQEDYVINLKSDRLFAFYSDNSDIFPLAYDRLPLFFKGSNSENINSHIYCGSMITAGFYYCEVSKARIINYYEDLCSFNSGDAGRFGCRFPFVLPCVAKQKYSSQYAQLSLFPSNKENLEKMYIPFLHITRKGHWNLEKKTGCAISYGLDNVDNLNNLLCPLCGRSLRISESSYNKLGRQEFYSCSCGHVAKVSYCYMSYPEILDFRSKHGQQKGLSL